MTTEEEQRLSARLHGLVTQPPPGRNLVPGIRRDVHRRRARVVAAGSSLGVTGVVVAGAVTASSLTAAPSTGVAAASASTGATTKARPAPVTKAVPNVQASSPTSPSAGGTTSPPPKDKVDPGTPPPAHETVSPQPDSAEVLRGTAYYYQRVMTESDGVRSYRREWVGKAGQSRYEDAMPAGSGVQSFTSMTDFTGEAGQVLTWDDFSSVPTASRLHTMLYGSLTAGESKSNRLAFKQVYDLLYGTPTTADFRRAVVAAVKDIPGVTVDPGVADEIGRSGERLALGTASYLVDPADGRLLQEDFTDGCTSPGGASWRSVVLDSGAVASDVDVLPENAAQPTGPPADCS